jgi:hypothetical protein
MNKALGVRLVPLISLLLFLQEIVAQPYLNIIDTRFAYSPDKGLFRQNYPPLTLSYFSVGASAPLQFKEKSCHPYFLVPHMKDGTFLWRLIRGSKEL